MKNLLTEKRSILVAVAATIAFTILRVIQLTAAVEYPAGLYAQGYEAFNIAYNVVLVLSAAVLGVTAYFDMQKRKITTAEQISARGCCFIGIAMIASGAVMALPVITRFSSGDGMVFVYVIGCAAMLVSGMSVFTNARIKAPVCFAVAAVIVVYIIRTVIYYFENPIITSMPQKLMEALFYMLTVFFWINAGRLFSGAEKKFTMAAVVAGGLAVGAITLIYTFGGVLLMLTSPYIWLELSNIADLEMIVTGLSAGFIAGTLLFTRKRPDEEIRKLNEKQAPDEKKARDIAPSATLDSGDVNGLLDRKDD